MEDEGEGREKSDWSGRDSDITLLRALAIALYQTQHTQTDRETQGTETDTDKHRQTDRHTGNKDR